MVVELSASFPIIEFTSTPNSLRAGVAFNSSLFVDGVRRLCVSPLTRIVSSCSLRRPQQTFQSYITVVYCNAIL